MSRYIYMYVYPGIKDTLNVVQAYLLKIHVHVHVFNLIEMQ